MKPYFIKGDKVFKIATLDFSDTGIRSVGYYDEMNNYRILSEQNDYATGDMITGLPTYIKWASRYEDLFNALVEIADKKHEAYNEAAHNLANGLNDTTHQLDVEKYRVREGEMYGLGEAVALVAEFAKDEIVEEGSWGNGLAMQVTN